MFMLQSVWKCEVVRMSCSQGRCRSNTRGQKQPNRHYLNCIALIQKKQCLKLWKSNCSKVSVSSAQCLCRFQNQTSLRKLNFPKRHLCCIPRWRQLLKTYVTPTKIHRWDSVTVTYYSLRCEWAMSGSSDTAKGRDTPGEGFIWRMGASGRESRSGAPSLLYCTQVHTHNRHMHTHWTEPRWGICSDKQQRCDSVQKKQNKNKT